jgi:SAM-dependent methyltransferase
MEIFICDICGGFHPEILEVKEMRAGLNESFGYHYCTDCGYLKIISIPADLSRYYQNYYTAGKPFTQLGIIRKLFWKIRAKLYPGIWHPLAQQVSFNSILDWAWRTNTRFNHRILDVGCGNGDVLFEFSKHGFGHLEGVDPYPPKQKHDVQFKIVKGDIYNLSNLCYDLIMFHHSFEHMADQESVLRHAIKHLNKGGKILIRMPLINQAFYDYREYWVQIDAPRHLALHSLKSFTILCDRVGLKIQDVFFDSTAFQFLGSEQNKKGITFFADNSYKTDLEKSIFSADDLKYYESKAIEYNKTEKGDQAGFVLSAK